MTDAQQTPDRHWVSQLPTLTNADPGTIDTKTAAPDRRDGAVYEIEQDAPLLLAVDVALATNRPLLLRGEPGSGKSSLAAFIARNLNWRYYEYVVTARSRARDLLYTFDSVLKLSDASTKSETRDLRNDRYIEPGVLWWAFDRESAVRRGAPPDAGVSAPKEPNETINATRSPRHSVVLVDEIDKADPDLPNGLLVPLGSGEFQTLETGKLVEQGGSAHTGGENHGRVLVIITTNEERDLPPAFLRRCVTHRLKAPEIDDLIRIGRSHLLFARDDEGSSDDELLRSLATKVCALRDEARDRGARPPSTAEFLDVLHACRSLGVKVGDATWTMLEQLVLLKDDEDPL